MLGLKLPLGPKRVARSGGRERQSNTFAGAVLQHDAGLLQGPQIVGYQAAGHQPQTEKPLCVSLFFDSPVEGRPAGVGHSYFCRVGRLRAGSQLRVATQRLKPALVRLEKP